MDGGRELAAFDEVELVGLGALARDLGARPHVDRLERARETREAHAIEVAEVRNESEEAFERVIVVVWHGARRLAVATTANSHAAALAAFGNGVKPRAQYADARFGG